MSALAVAAEAQGEGMSTIHCQGPGPAWQRCSGAAGAAAFLAGDPLALCVKGAWRRQSIGRSGRRFPRSARLKKKGGWATVSAALPGLGGRTAKTLHLC